MTSQSPFAVRCDVCGLVVPRFRSEQRTCLQRACIDAHHRRAAQAWREAHPKPRKGNGHVGDWSQPIPANLVEADPPRVVQLHGGVVAEVVWDGVMRRYGCKGGILEPRAQHPDVLVSMGHAQQGGLDVRCWSRERRADGKPRRHVVVSPRTGAQATP